MEEVFTMGKTNHKSIFSLSKKIFLLIFCVSLVICIFGAADMIFALGATVTYVGLAVVIAASFVFGIVISKRMTKPVNEIRNMILELKRGHVDVRCKVTSNDELGVIASELNEFADYYQNVVIKSIDNIQNGEISIAIDAYDSGDKAAQSIKKMIKTMKSLNSEFESVIKAAADGDLTHRCNEGNYNGSWKELAVAINRLCTSVSQPIDEVCDVMSHLAVNDFTAKMNGNYNGAFKQLSDNINHLVIILNSLQDLMLNISKGDLSKLDEYEKIGKLSENDNLLPSVIKMMKTIQALIGEVKYITSKTAAGNIAAAKGDPDKFEGGYKEIVEGFNATIDTISEPLNASVNALVKLAGCDLSERIDGQFKGDFAKVANAINDVHTEMSRIEMTLVKLSKGDISSLDAIRSVGKNSENDIVTPAFVACLENIQSLIEETTTIVKSVSQGDFSVRGDESKFRGGYHEIISGLNQLLEAVDKPISQVTNVMGDISQGKFGSTIDGEFSGKFKTLVDSVNSTSLALHNTIQNISDTLIQISDGNLNLENIDDLPGDLKAISDSVNRILHSLNDFLRTVSESSTQVASGSVQVSQGSQMLSQGATEQASAVEELSATIMEIASRTKQNAESAGKVNDLVNMVKGNAENGYSKMKEMLRSMNDINESSTNISKIIKVIDDIAFQTNILSLNAAVEAARAGQYGKGFAVVADEVRNLAAKSANAAKETTALIESSIKRVDSGTKIAKETAESFDEIVTGVGKTASLISEITISSNEQATGISQIDKGLSQVSQVIQTNSATAEQSAAASEELSSQAAVLNGLLKKFTLRDTSNSIHSAECNAQTGSTSNLELEYSNIDADAAASTDFGKY